VGVTRVHEPNVVAAEQFLKLLVKIGRVAIHEDDAPLAVATRPLESMPEPWQLSIPKTKILGQGSWRIHLAG
jgi:hypothetical protein